MRFLQDSAGSSPSARTLEVRFLSLLHYNVINVCFRFYSFFAGVYSEISDTVQSSNIERVT